MMLFLTGAQYSLTRAEENPQTDVNKSLGGYISSSPVPNGAVNVLFDLLSSNTLEKKPKETIAIALINKFDQPVGNVEIKITSDKYNIGTFKVAAVEIGNDFSMEQINNRYQEPLQAQFVDVSFEKASVELEITQAGVQGEEIALYPFNVVINIEESGIEGTWEAFYNAFENNDTYLCKRISETKFKIEKRDADTVIPADCSFLSSEGFQANFLSQFKNGVNKTALLSEVLQSGKAIGIWIQRQIKQKYLTDTELINNYKTKYNASEIEEMELIISYNLIEQNNYNQETYQPDIYS